MTTSRSVRRTTAALAAAVVLALPRMAAAQAGADARPVVAALEQAVAAQPADAVLHFFLAVFRARAGDAEGALDALEQALQRGDGLLPSDATFPALRDDPRFVRMKARYARRLPEHDGGRVVATLADRLLVPEGIAYDPVARAFYVGSIARRSIHRVRRDGSLAPLSRRGDDLDEVLGIAIDARSRRLYAVSTNALTAQGRARLRNAVKAYDLEAGRLVATFDVPEARQLNDVAILPEALLVTDSAAGAVWRIALAGGGVSAVVPPGGANGANGVAVAPSGDAAYVAAARRPLHVDLASGKVTPLVPPGRENAAAIDGLVWHDGALIGVQNFTTPGRIVRLPLAADGRSIVAVETLRSHHGEALDEPTTAAIAPDGLHVLTTTSVTRYADDGRVLDPGTVRAPRILRIPLAPRAGAPASK